MRTLLGAAGARSEEFLLSDPRRLCEEGPLASGIVTVSGRLGQEEERVNLNGQAQRRALTTNSTILTTVQVQDLELLRLRI